MTRAYRSDTLYDVAVILHPTKAAHDNGARAENVLGPTTIIAASAEEAEQRAILMAGSNHADNLDRIEVFVRPFVEA